MRLDDKKRPRTWGAPTEILARPRNVWSGTLRLETDRNRVRPSARTVGARDEDTHFRIIFRGYFTTGVCAGLQKDI